MQKMRRAVALLGALALVLGLAPLGAEPAAAAPEHRALVIVDTGSTVIKRTITFSEDSITGLAALQRAGADPVVYTYAGQGGAVCRLFGVGRDAGPGCLGGAGGDPRYWAYWRAPAGGSSFTYSRVGAGATQVRDGDVEGWRFGTGDAPPYSPVPAATPPPTVAPPPPSTVPPGRSGGGTSGGGAPGAPGATGGTADPAAPGAPAVDPVTGAPVAGPDASASTTTAPSGELPDTGDGARKGEDVRTQEAAARRSVGSEATDDGGGAPWSLALLALLLAGLAAAVVVARRRRSP